MAGHAGCYLLVPTPYAHVRPGDVVLDGQERFWMITDVIVTGDGSLSVAAVCGASDGRFGAWPDEMVALLVAAHQAQAQGALGATVIERD